ncbi:N-acetyl-alpha-D-glucosaminyl L-malate synthase BshA [Chlorobiota bacterium]|nr:N-acetyl-alpha-D-glucosaminyl L-malate synthase BshA [Chlorobiota bacterium]
MKIGIVCYPTYGGSGVVATELGIALAKRGHEVHFITYAQPMRLDRFQDNIFYHEVEQPNYPLFEFQLYSLALAGKIVDVVRYEHLDILHVHYAIPHAISGYLAKQILKDKTTLKLVTTLHGTDITLIGLEPTFLPLVKFSLDQSDAVTAVSRFLAEKTKTGFMTKSEQIVIPNFIDTNVYHRMECTNIRGQIAPNKEKILMHVSNFRPVKRVLDTIYILQEVLKILPAKLVLVGDGPDRAEAERLARDLGIWEHVKFLGKQNALPEILSAADVFLLTSQSESFGLAALEAMSCGVPVVATNIGGIPEVITHDESGFIAELGDIKRMAKYTLDLLTHPRKWQEFSNNARKRAVDHFDTQLIVPMYESLYQKLLEVE